MSDFKSKLPDIKELTSMTSKLFKGIKSSVDEIVKDYKDKRATKEGEKAAQAKKEAAPKTEKPLDAELSEKKEEKKKKE